VGRGKERRFQAEAYARHKEHFRDVRFPRYLEGLHIST
jgi:hypothetical protein